MFSDFLIKLEQTLVLLSSVVITQCLLHNTEPICLDDIIDSFIIQYSAQYHATKHHFILPFVIFTSIFVLLFVLVLVLDIVQHQTMNTVFLYLLLELRHQCQHRQQCHVFVCITFPILLFHFLYNHHLLQGHQDLLYE